MCMNATSRTSTKEPLPILGGMVARVPERRLKNGCKVSLNFVLEGGSTRGGPMTTEGLMVDIAKGGCSKNVNIVSP